MIYIADFIQVFALLFLLHSLFSIKAHTYVFVITGFVISIFYTFYQVLLPFYIELLPFLMVLCFYIYTYTQTNHDYKQKLFISISIVSLSMSIEYLITICFQAINLALPFVWIRILNSCLLICIAYFTLSYRLEDHISHGFSTWILILIEALLFMRTVGLHTALNWNTFVGETINQTYTIRLAVVCLINILFFFYYIHKEKESYELIYTKTKLLEFQNIEDHYEMMKYHLENEQRLRHDLKHILSLCQNNTTLRETDLLVAYDLTPFIETSNRYLNAVLNIKLQSAKNKGIHVETCIGSDLSFINEIDLAAILGNALDNAIEHSHPDTLIELHITENEGFCRIELSNDVDTSILSSNPDLHTSKADKLHHGYGISSIRKTVKKYHGSLQFQEKNHRFYVYMILKKP